MGNPSYITDIVSTPFIFPKVLVPGNGGVDLKPNAELKIQITPGNERPIFKIEFLNEENLKEVKIELKSVDGKIVEVINNKNPDRPIYPSSQDKIKEIVINIISVFSVDQVDNVEISVQSCSPESTQITTPVSLTTSSDIFSTLTG